MILNGPKRTIYFSGGLRLLQMVLESPSEDARPSRGGMWDPTSVGERNPRPSRGDCEIPYRLERGTLDPQGVNCEIPHQLERGTLDPQGMDCEIPHWLERERNIPRKGVETSIVNAF